MAGHSKWANIKHRKAAQDAKRSKIFTKLNREIRVAARLGGPNPEDNPRLRIAVDKALAQNMTKDTIERAIKKAAGDDDSANLEEITYEGYAPGGVAVLVEAMTDNRNRTAQEVRHAFSKSGGKMGTDGSVAFLFSRRGEILVASGYDEDRLLEVAMEAGAEDLVSQEEGGLLVTTRPEEFSRVKDALEADGFEPEYAEVTMAPSTYASLDVEQAEKYWKLVERLEDVDDVQNIYSNCDISEEVMAALESG